jgi:hypothetical protein
MSIWALHPIFNKRSLKLKFREKGVVFSESSESWQHSFHWRKTSVVFGAVAEHQVNVPSMKLGSAVISATFF